MAELGQVNGLKDSISSLASTNHGGVTLASHRSGNSTAAAAGAAQQGNTFRRFFLDFPGRFKPSKNTIKSQLGEKMKKTSFDQVSLFVICWILSVFLFKASMTECNLAESAEREGVSLYNTIRMRNISLDEFAANTLYHYFDHSRELLQYVQNNTAYLSPFLSSPLENYQTVALQLDGDYGTARIFLDRDNLYRQEGYFLIIAQVIGIVLWFVSALLFAKPIVLFIVEPFEKLLRLFDKLGRDPLGKLTFVYRRGGWGDDGRGEGKQHSLEKNDLGIGNRYFDLLCCRKGQRMDLDGMELQWLMNTIIQISSLLKVAYGSAGSDIIKQAVRTSRNVASGGQQVGLDIFSSKAASVNSIFVFCDIRRFTDATECLQEEIFKWVNQIAQVVHGVTDHYEGSANKNVGDAFLLSWSVEMQGEELAKSNKLDIGDFGHSPLNDSNLPSIKTDMADKALYSVQKMCAVIAEETQFIDDVSKI